SYIDKHVYFHSFPTRRSSDLYPENWTCGIDFGYTYNSNIADGFRKDFFLWNMSLAYTFGNKKWIAKVKVYDLLNQNTSNSRSIRSEEHTSELQSRENLVCRLL